MGTKFSFPHEDINADVPKSNFTLKNSCFRMLVVFPSIFVADTKLIYGYNFAALLGKLFFLINSSIQELIKDILCFE